jgi:acyl-CoA dehydrogenase
VTESMSEAGESESAVISAAVSRLLDDMLPVASADPAALWSALEEHGFTLVSVPERSGGSGGTAAHAAAVIETLAARAAQVPVGEACLLAGWALQQAGIDVPAGILTAAVGGQVIQQVSGGWRLTGTIEAVPCAYAEANIALITPHGPDALVSLVPVASCQVVEGWNLAGEPRHTIILDEATSVDTAAICAVSPAGFRARGALLRSIQSLGAAKRALELSCAYATVREQFGRPLARFQAIQHHLAEMAGEVSISEAAISAAVSSLDANGEVSEFAAAATKVQADVAAACVARLAHQVHGAIGFTNEHDLRLSTLRLWSWREEFGTEFEWAAWLAAETERRPERSLWELVCDA